MTETTITPEVLKAIGGSEWEKYGKRRVYFNNSAKWYGLKVTRNLGGGIGAASLDGEKISKSNASRIIALIGTVYYDFQDQSFHTTGDKEYGERIINAIKSQLKEATQEETEQQTATISQKGPVEADLVGLAGGRVIGGYVFKPDAKPDNIGRCARCGRPAPWITGAGEHLCHRHQDDY